MAQSNTLATLDPLLKENYSADEPSEIFAFDFPTLSRMERKTGDGNPMKQPLILAAGAGVASNLISAQASAQGIISANFMITPGDMIGIVPLSSKTAKAANSNAGAFVNYRKKELDAKLVSMGHAGSLQLFGAGGGAVGQRLSAAGNIITVADANTLNNIWVGQHLTCAVDNGSTGAGTIKAGFWLVTAVDRDAGTFTVSAIGDVVGNANNDFIFWRGMYNGVGSVDQVWKGLAAWLTLTAPTDTLHTLARTNRPETAGFRLPSATTGNPVDRLKKLAVHGFTLYQARPKLAIVHPRQWEVMSNNLLSQGIRPIKVGETDTIAGYSSITLVGQSGDIEVVSDPHCQIDRAYLLDMSTWTLQHLGEKLVEFEKDDKGAMYVPSTTEAGHEIRLTCFGNPVCEAPWKNGICALAVPAP